MNEPIPDAFYLTCLLADVAESPCACGKRPRGDRQELVGEMRRDTTSSLITDALATRVTCRLRCKVCGDVHKAAGIFATAPKE